MIVPTRNQSGQLLDYLQDRTSAMVALLKQLAEIESPSTVPQSQQPVQSVLRQALESRGFRVRHLRGQQTGGHLWAVPKRRPAGQPYQLILGHCDTVWPLGTLAQMPVHQRDGKLFGPGVYDMKAGLVQAIFAIDAIHHLGQTPTVTPVFLINSDEEIGSPESKHHIQRIAKSADRAFVAEPSLSPGGKLKTARKGVGRFSIRVVGKASHAGLAPQQGASAILELAHVVQALFALNRSDGSVTVNVGTIDGGTRPNVIAPESRAEVDVRVATQADADRVERAIRALAPATPGTHLEVTGSIGRPPMERTPRNRKLWSLARAAVEEMGRDVDQGTSGGGSDGNWTSQLTATLDGLGAVGDGAHALTEYVWTDYLAERAALLARLLLYPPLEECPR